ARGGTPRVHAAVEMTGGVDATPMSIMAEVAQQIGGSRVRAICMRPTDGLTRGAPVANTGHGIQMPVGDEVLGHIFNVWGEALDADSSSFDRLEHWDIHRDAPPFDELEPRKQMFETGIKVIDLLTPYLAGGKIGLFGGAG